MRNACRLVQDEDRVWSRDAEEGRRRWGRMVGETWNGGSGGG